MARAALAFAAIVALGVAPAALEIDTAKSVARFSVRHIWVEHVIGTVPIVSGTVTLPPGSAIPESATAELDATRIATGEPDRDKSLSSADFFDVAKFPRWHFESIRTVARGAKAFEMDGNLTLHGVTRLEQLNVTIGGTDAHPSYHATARIDRRAFGMAVTRLDPTIGGTADVTLDITLK